MQCNEFQGNNFLVQSQCNLGSLNLSLLDIRALGDAGTQNIKLLWELNEMKTAGIGMIGTYRLNKHQLVSVSLILVKTEQCYHMG